ncbi:uncharacterized protein DS421_3g79530 [Arachis hypogaea]|nr:uncharacterized protein DS421_3g79530 [Arachis hypogaea]
MPLTTGLRTLTNDDEMLKMCFYAGKNNGVAHVYYEHGVFEPEYVKEQQSSKGKELMYPPLPQVPTLAPNLTPTQILTSTPKPTPILIPTSAPSLTPTSFPKLIPTSIFTSTQTETPNTVTEVRPKSKPNCNPAVPTIVAPIMSLAHAIPPIDVPSQVGEYQEIQHEGQAEVELGMSQPIMSQNEDSLQMETSLVQHNARPPKLTTKRMVSQPSSTPPATNVLVDPIQGASSGTATRLASFMKFVPTPGFKPPRKKN